MKITKKNNRWIKGPANDWFVLFEYNMWFQFSFGLFAIATLYAVFFCFTKNFNALQIAVFAYFLSSIVLGSTEFGRGTVSSYRRTREIIQRKGQLAPVLQKKIGGKLYCYRAGARAAVIKHSSASKLLPVLANKWKPY